MARIKLRFVNAVRDRYGSVRYYFRRPGAKNVRLPGVPGSAEFMEAYAAAAAGDKFGAERVGKPLVSGSVAATVRSYLGSAAFAALAPDSKRTRRNTLERFAKEHGNKNIAGLQRAGVQNLIDAKRSTPGAARNLLSALAVLMAYAVENGLREDNPTVGVKRPRLRTEGFAPWSEEDIAAFESQHPIGTQARLAFSLLLYTAQRRGDIIRMGRQHLRNGVISVRQQKTGTELSIPVLAELQTVLDATPSEHMTFLVTAKGAPFSVHVFSHWFAARCREAGLPKGRSPHGLRKAACRRLAEAGCSASVIASISGHKTLTEVARYCRSADQLKMARQGMEAISRTRSYKQDVPFCKSEKKA
jgi:integrase